MTPKLQKDRKTFRIPNDQVVIEWRCQVCNKGGLFTIPRKSPGQVPFEVALGLHRTMSERCQMHDVTLTAEKGVMVVVLAKDKSPSPAERKKLPRRVLA